MRMDINDLIFHYRGFWNCQAHCRLRLARCEEGDIVLASELADNQGTSITNMAEDLATLVVRQFNLTPEHLVWIEHYGRDSYREPDEDFEERYDWVEFSWDGQRFSAPQWKGVDRIVVEQLIGQSLEEGVSAPHTSQERAALEEAS